MWNPCVNDILNIQMGDGCFIQNVRVLNIFDGGQILEVAYPNGVIDRINMQYVVYYTIVGRI